MYYNIQNLFWNEQVIEELEYVRVHLGVGGGLALAHLDPP